MENEVWLKRLVQCLVEPIPEGSGGNHSLEYIVAPQLRVSV